LKISRFQLLSGTTKQAVISIAHDTQGKRIRNTGSQPRLCQSKLYKQWERNKTMDSTAPEGIENILEQQEQKEDTITYRLLPAIRGEFVRPQARRVVCLHWAILF